MVNRLPGSQTGCCIGCCREYGTTNNNCCTTYTNMTYTDAIRTIIKLPDDVKEASKYNYVQKMAKVVETRTGEELWELVHAANEKPAPARSRPFKFQKMEESAHSKSKKSGTAFWTRAELRTILSIAQNLPPTTQFYESLRLQHAKYVETGPMLMSCVLLWWLAS